MPESTPIYGFTSPCPDETVTPAAFTTLANQIDAKLADVNNDLTLALERPGVMTNFGTQTIPANTDTVLTVPGSSYIIPAAGVWIVRAFVTTNSSPTVNAMQARIRQNGVNRLAFIHNTEGNVTNPPTPIGPIVAAAGDTISILFFYSGAGTMDVFGHLAAKMIVRIP